MAQEFAAAVVLALALAPGDEVVAVTGDLVVVELLVVELPQADSSSPASTAMLAILGMRRVGGKTGNLPHVRESHREAQVRRRIAGDEAQVRRRIAGDEAQLKSKPK